MGEIEAEDTHLAVEGTAGEAEDHGAMIAFHSRVENGTVEKDGIRLDVADSDGETMTLKATTVVNSAGLGAQGVAHAIDGVPGTAMPPWRPLLTEEEALWIADYLLETEAESAQ